jgi:hypothetical protein
LVETAEVMPVSSEYSSVLHGHTLPRIKIVHRLWLSTLGFHVLKNTQLSRFFQLPKNFWSGEIFRIVVEKNSVYFESRIFSNLKVLSFKL